MREKRVNGMIWRRAKATYAVVLPLAAAIAAWLLASHTAMQWWALEGAPLLLLAYLCISLADLKAAAGQSTGDKRNLLRFCAALCTFASVLLVIGFLTGRVPFAG